MEKPEAKSLRSKAIDTLGFFFQIEKGEREKTMIGCDAVSFGEKFRPYSWHDRICPDVYVAAVVVFFPSIFVLGVLYMQQESPYFLKEKI